MNIFCVMLALNAKWDSLVLISLTRGLMTPGDGDMYLGQLSTDTWWHQDHAITWSNGWIRLSVSTVNHTYKLSRITHVTENIRLGPVLTDRESVPTASCSPVSPFLQFVVTEPSRMKSVHTEGCHMGLFQERIGTACCTYRQSNMTSVNW